MSRSAKPDPLEAARQDYRSLENWVERFTRIAGNFKWFFRDGCKIRTRIDGTHVCPMLAYGYHRSASQGEERYVPDSRNMSGAANVHDSVAAAVVHIADDMRTSRYWSEAVRKKLLAACKLAEENATDA